MGNLKFRHYDLFNNEMLYSCSDFCNLEHYFSNRGYDSSEEMQFTGLKDKNGVDIYEGDIVTCSYHGWQWAKGAKKVEYSAKYGFDPVQAPVDYGDTFAESEYWEVVGNIHENPDLLKSRN